MADVRASLAAYDAVPYRSRAVPEAHPDSLGALAAVHGLEPALSETCRVLELGCASGVNLMAMAGALPAASFLGIDGSERQVAEGERLRRDAGLDNVRLVAARFESLAEDLGEFDYVLCHGVFSWVPPDVQDRVLALCRSRLAPGGLAFVSYNVYPGWHSREMLREMMLFHVRAIEAPAERVEQARALMELLARLSKDEQGTYRARFASMAQDLAGSDDGYFFHEFLEDDNRPAYFHQVVARARAAGLRYVASTCTPWEAFPPREVDDALAPLEDRVVREQYLDFLSDRTFRRSVFCRDDAGTPGAANPARVRELFASGRARPKSAEPDLSSDAVEEFVAGQASGLFVGRPLVKAALAALHEAMPRTLSFDELRRETARLSGAGGAGMTEDDIAGLLVRAFPAGLLRLSTRPSPCAWPPPERPFATSFARVQAKEGTAVTTLLHRTTELDDLHRLVLRACDGSRTRTDLARFVAESVERGDFQVTAAGGAPLSDPELVATAARDAVETALIGLGRMGLFAAPARDD